MRVLFISREGHGLGVAQRLALEGHSVDVYIASARARHSGRGIVGRVAEWRPAARRADLVVADCAGLGKCENDVRATNRPTLGFSGALDALVADPALTAEMFSRAGIKSAPLNGDGPAPPSGVHVSTEGWFNGSAFVRPFVHSFVDRRFLAGDLGVETESVGAVVVRAAADSRLTRDTIERAEPFLRLLGYRGAFGVCATVDAEAAWGRGLTTAPHYDAMEAWVEGLEEPLFDFLFDLAMGTKREAAVSADTMIAVRLSVPPWPQVAATAPAPAPLGGIDDDALVHLFLSDVRRDSDTYATAGGGGVVLKATALGSVTPPKPLNNGKRTRPDYTYEARRRVYRLLDRIDVPDKQYRTDIGARVNGDMAQLKEWGWL